MNLTITPSRLSGVVTPPPSKSQAHRCLIAAKLAENDGFTLSNLAQSQDIQATERCMAALKAPGEDLPHLDCGESGSTLRFLIPVALALRGGGVFTGHGRLMERPQQPYFDIFDAKGIQYGQTDGVLTVRGALTPGIYCLPGNVSSQFVTGLLYALPLLDGDSKISLTTKLESRGYVDMTVETLAQFGVQVERRENSFLIPGGQRYLGRDMAVESDWSQAAFWFAAMRLGNQVQVRGLNRHSSQGDRMIRDYFVDLSWPGAVEIDISQCPDLAPPLAVMAAVRQGTTRLTNAARLRIKESDRLSSIARTMNSLGSQVEEGPDFLAIHGQDVLSGGCVVDCCNDHRIAMMAAIAATRCQEPVTLLGAECVAKSYPGFWEDYKMLGGTVFEYSGE